MRKTLGIATAAVVLTLASAGVATPAYASTTRKACVDAHYVCVWANKNFTGNSFSATTKWHGSCVADTLIGGQSVANGRHGRVRFFSKTGCKGAYIDIPADNWSTNTHFRVHSFEG